MVQAGVVAEDTSHQNVASQFLDLDGTIPRARRHLPAKETPRVPWGDPRTDWVNIVDYGADATGKGDSSQALQAAIDSGARTVYLPGGGHFFFDGEVRVRGLCERITGSWIGAHVIGRGSGDIFLDDYCGRLDLESPRHHVCCRQLNTEHQGTMLTNNGASLWILGMKTEKIGTIIHTLGGGTTDLLGCFVYSNRGWDESIPAFVIEDSTANLCGLNERNFNGEPCNFWFREIVAGQQRSRQERAWVYLSADRVR